MKFCLQAICVTALQVGIASITASLTKSTHHNNRVLTQGELRYHNASPTVMKIHGQIGTGYTNHQRAKLGS